MTRETLLNSPADRMEGGAHPMSNQFVERNGEKFKVLASDGSGAWLISYDSPAAPFFVGDMDAYQRIVPPSVQSGELSAAGQKRLELIQPLLDAGNAAITDKAERSKLARLIAATHSTTPRRVLRLYYRYLATGQLLSPKARAPSVNPDYEWAIRTFYFSAKKLSLRGAFEMMLLQRYTDFEGNLAPTRPTFGSFRAYFYSRNYHKSPRKIIARDGLTHYQRNCQPAFGSASTWRKSPGSYQMDATEADIYLRSPGGTPFRPYIYLAVDSATQLIAGVWVGEACDEMSVMCCLENACRDKAEWCGRHGITIDPEQWPSHGLPYEVITDKGREFCGARMQELCRRYGVELISQAPFRPDRKGLVEQAFHLLQERYKPLLRGKGVIEPDAQERWAIDYRAQAILTLEDFTQVLIHCIVYLNSGRTLSSGHTPAQLWAETTPQLLDVDAEELRLMALPRTTAKLSRKGVRVNGVLYVPADMDGLYLGDTLTLAYNPANLSRVYLAEHDWRVCKAAPGQGVEELSLSAYQAAQERRRAALREAEGVSTSASIDCLRGIQGVIQGHSPHTILDAKRLYHDLAEQYGQEIVGRVFGDEKSIYLLNRVCKWECLTPERYALLQCFAGIDSATVFSSKRLPNSLENKLRSMSKSGIRYGKKQLCEHLGITAAQLNILARKYRLSPFWAQNDTSNSSTHKISVVFSDTEHEQFKQALAQSGFRYDRHFAHHCILEYLNTHFSEED